MAGPNSAKRPQGNRTRPKSVAVAVPLKYEKKKSQKAVTPEKNQNNITTTKFEDTSSPETCSEPFYTPNTASTSTTNGGPSLPRGDRTLKSTHFELSLPSQQNPGQHQDSGGVASSWAGNAQSTCIIEHDQGKTHMLFTVWSYTRTLAHSHVLTSCLDFEGTHDSTQIAESKKPLPHSNDSEQHQVSVSTTSAKNFENPKITAPTKGKREPTLRRKASYTLRLPCSRI